MKKLISVLLAVTSLVCIGMSANAVSLEAAPALRFDSNGEFKVLHLTDCQDIYPASDKMIKYINTVLDVYKPDLVVLGGDNVVCAKEYKEDAIKQLVTPFVEHKTYFTLVFGNHDHQQEVDKDTLFEMYVRFGEGYCLAYDAVPEMSGTATHYLPILGSKDDEIKFNLWMFDSGTYVSDENGKDLGYDCVREDQIEWYKTTSKALEAQAGHKVPSLAFQHIIVGEVYDNLFYESPIEMGELTRSFNGKVYSFFPKLGNFSGYLLEFPCPGYYNLGQFDAMVERGDVLAIFSGHDHTNSFETEIDGIKIINSPSITYHSYASELNRGARLITIKENDPNTFTSEIISVNELALSNPDYAKDADISLAKARFIKFISPVILGITKVIGVFFK